MMRRWMAAALAALMVLSLAACAGSQQEEQSASAEATEQSQSASVQEEEEPASPEEPASTEQQPEEPSNAQESGVLVAYFSWADNTVIDGEVDAVASCLYTQIPESRINTELFNHHQKTEYPYNHTENAF